ncbi:hypothetical protein B7494_g1347 [Chlorociboria aeruginascens]|nr:hypothetical protein B7494_g1347 [Chlorociboria aeruginascens]
MMSPESRLALGVQDPELTEVNGPGFNIQIPITNDVLQLLKDAPPARGLDGASDIFKLREHLAAMKKALTAANTKSSASAYSEEDREIPMRDGQYITVRIHRPQSESEPAEGCPGLVMFHGGGFCLGGLDNETALCRMWTDLGGIAVNVDYRLAPENPFPAPVHDAYDALTWTASHIEELGIDAKKGFVVGGVSAGANLAVVLSHLYRDEGLSPPLTGQYLSIPTTCEPKALPAAYRDVYLSREQNKNGLILNQKSIDMFENLYKPDPTSPLRSPLVFPSHQNLPPAYFQICGADPLRDEGLIYESILRESGIKTRLDIYPGLPHGFWTWFPEASFSKKFQADTVEGLRYLLGQSV